MENVIREMIQQRLSSIFNKSIPNDVMDRVESEINYFKDNDFLDFIGYIAKQVECIRKENGYYNIFNTRLSESYSLVLYLLGINDINPLDSYEYDHKDLGRVIDGFGLPFSIFKIMFEKEEKTLSLSFYGDSKNIIQNGNVLHLVHNKLVEAVLNNLKTIRFPIIYEDTVLPYITFEITDDISSVIDKKTLSIIEKYSVNDFDGLVRAIALAYGTGVMEANILIGRNDIENMIITIDDLYNELSKYVGDKLAIETCIKGVSKGSLPVELKNQLLIAGVNQCLLDFIDTVVFMYTRGGAISEARSVVKLVNSESMKK